MGYAGTVGSGRVCAGKLAMKIKKRLLVTGNMRSGTTWMTHALRAVDIDCQHECMGEDGTVSWFFAIDAKRYPFNPNNTPKGRTAHVGEGRRRDYKFEHIVHLVRDPIKVIGSMVAIMPTAEQVWLAENGVISANIDRKTPKLLRMMQAWYAINRQVEKDCTYRARLEDVVTSEGWEELMSEFTEDVPLLPLVPVKNSSRGIFKAKKITFGQMAEQDYTLAKNIASMARKYGYKY